MPTPLLRTKLFIPSIHGKFISRPRLVQQFEAGVQPGQRLLLISAPAGSGKTTAITEWVQQAQTENLQKIGWYSLDESDNHPVQFWSYLFAAMRTILPQSGQSAQVLLHAPELPPAAVLLTELTNEITESPVEIVLVLDDYHVIHERSLHEGITFLLENAPPNLHLILSTRADPPLPLARLRARGQMTNLRGEQLRFTPNEIVDFFNQQFGAHLSAQELQTLEERTEGWAVGLQMAALALQSISNAGSQPHAAHFIDSITGSYHYILDYLLEEVLNRQSKEIQDFLLCTAILDRFNGQLCDAILARTGSQSILEQLDHANLFLIPLDRERRWFRFHHLFAELLRVRLQAAQPETILLIHNRAADWLEQNGWLAEAVRHALAGSDFERAARIVEQSNRTMLASGELMTLLSTIQVLPEELARSRPWLCIEQIWVYSFAGEIAKAAALLQETEQRFFTDTQYPVPPQEKQEMAGNLRTQQAFIALLSGQPIQAMDFAVQAKELLPQEEQWVHTVLYWTEAYVQRMLGQIDRAYSSFERVVQIGLKLKNIWPVVMSMTDMGIIRRIQGNLRQATAIFREELRLAAEYHAEHLGYVGRAQAGLALVLYEQNQMEEARSLAQCSIGLNEIWQNPNHLVYSYLIQIRLQVLDGDFSAATQTLEKSAAIIARSPVVPVLQNLVTYHRVRLWIAQNDSLTLSQWAHHVEPTVQHIMSSGLLGENTEAIILAFIRALMHLGQTVEAEKWLALVQENTHVSGRLTIYLECLLLRAQLYQSSPKTAEALAVLENAVEIGAAGGFQRSFLDEGPSLQNLLQQLRLKYLGKESKPWLPYLENLLSAFSAASPTIEPPAPRQPGIVAGLVEPVSERELEVLRLLAAGKTNPEIAETLIIAIGTVKAHIASLYGKLDVHTRTQAVARARALGLLTE